MLEIKNTVTVVVIFLKHNGLCGQAVGGFQLFSIEGLARLFNIE